jgi:hypothetical protein
LNRIVKVILDLIEGSVDLARSNKFYLKEFEDFKHAKVAGFGEGIICSKWHF